jgi:hypothetical protein
VVLRAKISGSESYQVDEVRVTDATTVTPPPSDPALRDGRVNVEAESLGDEAGDVNSGANNNGTGLSAFAGGDYVKFAGVDFGTNATTFEARVAVPAATHAQVFELRLGGLNGTLIGTYTMQSTGGWTTYATQSSSIVSTSGVHDLYLVATGGSASGVLDWFLFS